MLTAESQTCQLVYHSVPIMITWIWTGLPLWHSLYRSNSFIQGETLVSFINTHIDELLFISFMSQLFFSCYGHNAMDGIRNSLFSIFTIHHLDKTCYCFKSKILNYINSNYGVKFTRNYSICWFVIYWCSMDQWPWIGYGKGNKMSKTKNKLWLEL